MLYILLIAIVNILVGFAVAVSLGNRCRAIAMADQRWEVDQLPLPVGEPPAPEDEVNENDERSGIADEERDESDEASPEEANTGTDADQSEPDADVTAEEKESQEKSKIALAIEALQAEAEELNDQLAETDDQLRTCLDSPEAAEIEGILDSLRGATDEYLDKRNAAQETLSEASADDEKYDSMRMDIEAAITKQNESVESVTSAIDSFDYEGDLRDGCQRMIDETGILIDDNRQLVGELDKAAVEVAGRDDSLEDANDNVERDSLTGLSSRAGMEADMEAWWKEDPQRLRQLSMILVELDKLEEINEEHGQKTGNAVIRSIAQLLRQEIGEEGSVARISGKRFLLTCHDIDVREATRIAEHARQTLEKMSFLHKDTQIEATASFAVAEANPEDSTETLVGRVETTLLEATRYGHNRTFLFEGDYPTPVTPPSFDLIEKEVVI